jgi:cell division control protein 24
MWRCLRRGYPLMTIYNALNPVQRLEIDASKVTPANRPKKASFLFVNACLKDLNFPPDECFVITDLFGDDTTGFVKVRRYPST